MVQKQLPYAALIKQLSTEIQKRADAALQESDLTMTQMYFLGALSHLPGCAATLKELERHFRVAQSTAAGVAARLEKKGAVAVSRSGLPYRYGAAQPREHYERELLEDLKKRVFRGSGLRMVSSFMQLEPLSREDLAELRRVIDESFGEEDAP